MFRNSKAPVAASPPVAAATPTKAVTRIVAVTACPTGIAHTYMAADSLTQVADELGIGVRTAETYRQLIMQKLQAGSVAELVRIVVEAMPRRGTV